MNAIAIYAGDTAVFWNGIVICLGIASGFLLSYALYTAHSGKGGSMWAMFTISIVLGVLLSRLVHSWCHREQYSGMISALTDYSSGSYFLPGAVLGLIVSATIVSFFGFHAKPGELLDAAAPGAALSIALIRLSHFFTTACRSKIVVSNPKLRRIPLFVSAQSTSGGTEYRFATFFASFTLMLLAAVFLVVFYYYSHRTKMKDSCSENGHVWRIFMLIYCSTELVLDSTRNDSTFLYFKILSVLNKYSNFVSLTQLIAAIAILSVFLYYSRCAAVYDGRDKKRLFIWAGFLFGLAGTGISEYLVQRYSNRYVLFYSTQSAAVLIMAIFTFIMYRRCTLREDEEEPSFLPETKN